MDTTDCEVKVSSDGSILVDWEDEQGQHQIYTGSEVGDGHFDLKANGGVDKMSLHRFPNGLTLDGRWVEDGDEGMLTIFLGD